MVLKYYVKKENDKHNPVNKSNALPKSIPTSLRSLIVANYS